MTGMNFHITSHRRFSLRWLLCAGVLGGLVLLHLPQPGHAQQSDQQMQQEEVMRTLLGNITGEDLTGEEEQSSTTTSPRRASIPSIPQPDDIGSSVRDSVRSNLRSSCSERCSNVYQSKLRTCDVTSSPQTCANRAQAKLQLCRVQCN
ncbi:MAG: hypothetical protein ACOCWR_06785 [Oceanidesulfovibrio sp.]